MESEFKRLLLSCFLLRLINCLLTKTWFVPDEFWQSHEVAHHLAFNYGYLTWEWRVGIRSYVYPLLIASIYKLLQFLHLDNTIAFILIPSIFHTFLTAFGDVLLYLYAQRVYKSREFASKVLLCRLMSWLTMYFASRSLTNCLEEFFTIFCIYLMSNIRNGDKNTFWSFHFFAFLSFVIRATAAINLIPIYFYSFFVQCDNKSLKLKFFTQFIIIGLLTLVYNVAIDSYFHGSFLITAYNFLHYNVFHNVASHYGTHPWHWYLTQVTFFLSSTMSYYGILKKFLNDKRDSQQC
jgi:GPI mannosyltransferase 3